MSLHPINADAQPPQSAYYQDCLEFIINFYDIQADLKGIIASTPIDNEYVTIKNIENIAEKLDLHLKKVKLPFSKIATLTTPAILDLNDKACAYHPDANGNGVFHVPDFINQDIALDDILDAYSGTCYLLIPREQASHIDLSHMKSDDALDWFWQPILSFWDRYAEIIVISIFINLLALTIPLYTLNVYDRVVVNFVEDTLIVLTIGVMTAMTFDFIFKTIRSHITERIALKTAVNYDMKLMERMLSIKEVDLQLTTGEKSNLFRELQSIKDFYAARLVPTCVDLPFFLLFTLVIYMLAPPLIYIPISAAILVFILNISAQSLISRYTAQHFQSAQNKSAYLVEMLSGLSTIKMLGANGPKLLKWQQATHNANNAANYSTMITLTVSNLSALITQIGQICIIFYGAYLINESNLTIGGLVACSILYGRSIAPIASIATILSRLKQSKDVLKAINTIFELPYDDETQKGQKGPFKGDITIKDLSYQYPGQARPALYKINTEIKAGEHIGLIGKTGAGKSTLSNILTGALTPVEGQIFLDNTIYTSITQTELRRSIGYVPQEGHFFTGSMLENITMGNEAITKSNLEQAIHFSGLDLVLEQTAEGLDMNVGEGGKRLSGGQKQALSLARAFARSPEILVFDEPTNGMDSALEHRIKATIAEFTKHKTFIMITHRTTLLSLVSRLILLDQGRIIADGARDDIIKKLSKS